MMSPEVTFFFYLGAVACFAIAAFLGATPKALSRVGFVPLGLALFVFPTLWNTGKAAF